MQDVASLRESPAPAARMPRQGPSTEGLRESTTEISAPAGSARKISWFLVRLAIACALLAYLVKSGVIDWRALSRPFTAWPIALAAVALVLVDVSFNALRLSWLFRPHGLNLSWAKSFQVTMISFFFTQFLPGATGGDLARLFYVAKGLQRPPLGNRHRVPFGPCDRNVFTFGNASTVRTRVFSIDRSDARPARVTRYVCGARGDYPR